MVTYGQDRYDSGPDNVRTVKSEDDSPTEQDESPPDDPSEDVSEETEEVDEEVEEEVEETPDQEEGEEQEESPDVAEAPERELTYEDFPEDLQDEVTDMVELMDRIGAKKEGFGRLVVDEDVDTMDADYEDVLTLELRFATASHNVPFDYVILPQENFNVVHCEYDVIGALFAQGEPEAITSLDQEERHIVLQQVIQSLPQDKMDLVLQSAREVSQMEVARWQSTIQMSANEFEHHVHTTPGGEFMAIEIQGRHYPSEGESKKEEELYKTVQTLENTFIEYISLCSFTYFNGDPIMIPEELAEQAVESTSVGEGDADRPVGYQ